MLIFNTVLIIMQRFYSTNRFASLFKKCSNIGTIGHECKLNGRVMYFQYGMHRHMFIDKMGDARSMSLVRAFVQTSPPPLKVYVHAHKPCVNGFKHRLPLRTSNVTYALTGVNAKYIPYFTSLSNTKIQTAILHAPLDYYNLILGNALSCPFPLAVCKFEMPLFMMPYIPKWKFRYQITVHKFNTSQDVFELANKLVGYRNLLIKQHGGGYAMFNHKWEVTLPVSTCQTMLTFIIGYLNPYTLPDTRNAYSFVIMIPAPLYLPEVYLCDAPNFYHYCKKIV